MNIHNKILAHTKKELVVTTSEIAELLKISWNTAEIYLLQLQVQNKLIKIKKKGVNVWLIR